MVVIITECTEPYAVITFYLKNDDSSQACDPPKPNGVYEFTLMEKSPSFSNGSTTSLAKIRVKTGPGFNNKIKTSIWRPESKVWVFTPVLRDIPNVNIQLNVWDETKIKSLFYTPNVGNLLVTFSYSDEFDTTSLCTVDNVAVSRVRGNVPVVEETPVVEVVNRQTSHNRLSRVIAHGIKVMEIGALSYLLFNDLTQFDYSGLDGDSFLFSKLGSILECLQQNELISDRDDEALLRIKHVITSWLIRIGKFRSDVRQGKIGFADYGRELSKFRDNGKMLLTRGTATCKEGATTIKNSLVEGELVSLIEGVESLLDWCEVISDKLDSGAKVSDINHQSHVFASFFNDGFGGVTEQFNDLGLRVDEMINTLTSVYDQINSDIDDAYENVHEDIIDASAKQIAILNNLNSKLDTILANSSKPPEVLSTTNKPMILSAPIHGIRNAEDDFSNPPPYSSTSMIFLNPLKNKVTGSTSGMPFSPGQSSMVATYQSISGITIPMCYGALLNYGAYLVTDGNTILTPSVPYSEVDVFEDLRIRLWYNAALQSDFSVTKAVFYGSFDENPLLLSN